MTSEMKGFLSELLSNLIVDSKCCITVTRTANTHNICLVVANIPSRKVCLLGNVTDPTTGDNGIGAAMIDVSKWKWASHEGFTMDQIFSDLSDVVFINVSPGDLHKLLV